MIIEQQKEALVMSTSTDVESIKMSLDLDSAQILMQMMSKNLYSDPIGSTIREATSNALDSHRRAMVNIPIIVSLRMNSGNYEFSVEDKGIGLDDEDVKNIISKYGKSTKRDKANEIGMVGAGFKAPLAYCSSFYFVCRKNGVERKYMMYEGEDVNTIDLLYETVTEEDNGVKIIVPVKYVDKWTFLKKMKEQLAYFQNVYFDVDESLEIFNNRFSIIRHELFQYSELCNSNELHLCLDDVYYPLDWDKLGIKRINAKLAIRCSLTDGIYPVPSREQLRYNNDSKKIILNKICFLSSVLITKYNEQIKDSEDISVISNTDAKVVKFEGLDVNIIDFIPHSDIIIQKLTIKGITLLEVEKFNSYEKANKLVKQFKIKHEIANGKFREIKYETSLYIKYINNKKIIYVYDGRISDIMKEYLKSLHSDAFLVKNTKIPLGNEIRKRAEYNENTYYQILELNKHPKKNWRQLIKDFQTFQSYIIKNFISLNDVEIPKEFLEVRKKKRELISKKKTIKLSGEITINYGRNLLRDVYGKYCKCEPSQYKINELHKNSFLTVYGTKEEEEMLQKLYSVIKNKNKMNVAIISEREEGKIKDLQLHNFIKISTFMKGENKPFKRIITSYLIKELILKNTNLFYTLEQLKFISIDLKDKLTTLQNYKSQWFCAGSDKMYEAMLVIAKEHNLFDEEIYSLYKECKFILDTLPFINILIKSVSSYNRDENETYLCIIRDLCKYYKFKINWQYYKCPVLNYEIKEVLTEEKIAELA